MVKAREKMIVKNECGIVCLSKGGAPRLLLVLFWPLLFYVAQGNKGVKIAVSGYLRATKKALKGRPEYSRG